MISKTIDMPSNLIGNYNWTADGQAVIYVNNIGGSYFNNLGGVSNVWQRSLDGSSPVQLTDFKSGLIWWLDLSRDGKQLALSRGETSGDVVLISNFR